MNTALRDWPPQLRRLAVSFVLVAAAGVTAGLLLVAQVTGRSMAGMRNYFRGSPVSADDIPEYFPKPLMEMLVTTHNHLISLAVLFAFMGFLVYFARIVPVRWKSFLMLEPFVSLATTFGGLWLVRFVHGGFVWLVLCSSAIVYATFYLQAVAVLVESHRASS